MATPPDWYDDPQDRGMLRWWDGQAWTEHRRPAPSTSSAALGSSVQPALQDTVAVLSSQVAAAEQRLSELKRELESVEEAIEIQSFGFYRPRYGFQTSDEYAERLKGIREEQRLLIKSDAATRCSRKWTIGGSEAAGRKMITNLSKLMLRGFNGDCDAAILKAKYDNVVALEERIRKSWEAVNKLGELNEIAITAEYLELKLAELRLVHEHREKQQNEREEQRRIRDRLRDEAKAREEIERAQADAEIEEARYAKALANARAELEAASGNQHEKLAALVSKLEHELNDAIDRKAKAVARAQLTRSGHVYVLSNIGSFGPDVFKIGLTRRLDPYERVDELGAASVPFAFDVHAIIFAEDAPALEHALHKELSQFRVNMVNHRKEYFRVSLDQVRAAVEKHHGLINFVLAAEAEEWRKTRAMLDEQPVLGTNEGSALAAN